VLGGVHASSNCVPRRNPAHFSRPLQHSSSHRHATHSKSPITLHHITLLSSPTPPLPLQRMSPQMGPKRACDADSLPSTFEEMLATPGGDGACWGRNPGGSVWAAWALYQRPRPNALCVHGSATSRGPPERRKCHGRGSRVHGDRSLGPLGPSKITDIPVRAAHGAHGPRMTAIGGRWASMPPDTNMRPRALVCILEPADF
jgi:hypothetical protein